jgi:hypothetical protein
MLHRFRRAMVRSGRERLRGKVEVDETYLDEFTFRFNRRTSRSRGLLFYRLLEQAVDAQPVTYQRIAARKA